MEFNGKILPVKFKISGGCSCVGSHKDKLENYVVMVRKGNYSHFNYPKGRFHPSDYSSVRCVNCFGMWRTRANYVGSLLDSNYDDVYEEYKRRRVHPKYY